MPNDVPANVVTWGSVVTFGDWKAVADSRSHRLFRAPRTISANQVRTPLMTLSANPTPMSAADPALHDGEQDGCEDRECVADQGELERALGLLHLRRVTAGGEVADAADGQEE